MFSLDVAAACPDHPSAFVCLDSSRYSAPFPLHDLARSQLEYVRPNGQNNLIYVRDQLKLNVTSVWGEWAVLARQSATLHATDGAVRVIADIESSGKPKSSYQESVQLEMQGFSGVGLGWRSPHMPLNQRVSWRIGIQGIKVQRYLYRDLDGRVSYNSFDDVYSLMAQSTYRSDRLTFAYQKPVDSNGQAWLADLSVRMSLTAQSSLSMGLEDWGRLWWGGLPQDKKRLSSNTSSVDENGYVVYQPLVQGRYSQMPKWQAVWPTTVLSLKAQPSERMNLAFEARQIDHAGVWLPSISASYPWQGVTWHSAWLMRERALVLGLDTSMLSLRIGGDRRGAGAKSMHASVALVWPFTGVPK